MQTRPRATIRPKAIAANWQAFARRAGAAQAGAVIKADAYGTGLASTARALAGAGCRTFFVAYGFEALAARQALGPGPDIYVFHGAGPGEGQALAARDCRPVLNTLESHAVWLQETGGAPYALHFDTGMNRLGLRPETAVEVAGRVGHHAPRLLLSHYACADAPGHALNVRQLKAFHQIAAQFPGVATSLANTAGHFLGPDHLGDVTRPGIGLYGGGTSPACDIALAAAVVLHAPILAVSDVPADETVGYGASGVLSGPARLATVALGYGDGFPRSAGNSGFGYLGNVRCRIIGRVSMDLITLDVSAAAGLAKPGALVEMIGDKAGLEDQAACAGTLGYELLTGMGPRIERVIEN